MSRTPGDHLTKARTTLADARRIASLVPRVAGRDLAGSYDIKQHSDYQVGPEEVFYDVTDAEATITRAGELIEAITALVKL